MVPANESREAPFQSSAEESAYHQNWPIMVEETSSKRRGKGILILLLLVLLAGSAVAGFVLFKGGVFGARGPSTGPSANSAGRAVATDTKPQEDQRTVSPPAAAQAGARPGIPGQLSAAVSPSPAPVAGGMHDSGKSQEIPQTGQAGAQTAQSSEAKVTLQAASFPSEGSAIEFQDRLVKAGLPAYVVAADIPHRGKWYRVRAGKFSSQDEARQAAESWHKRMAAAGINSQLVPCQYQ